MKMAFYAGATGLVAHQHALNTIGNNIANVNTNGYQKQNVSFEHLLYSEMYANSEKNPLNGSGVKATDIGVPAGANPLKSTDYPLDFAIVGDGFFAVQNGNQIQYTRDGAFAVSLEGGEQGYLSTQAGLPVLGVNGQRIPVNKKADGSYDDQAILSSLAIYNFDYSGALNPVSGNAYLPTEKSGAAEIDHNSKVISRCLEVSGTSIVDEMSNMIAAQRAYQLSARVVQVADEVEQTVNNLRK